MYDVRVMTGSEEIIIKYKVRITQGGFQIYLQKIIINFNIFSDCVMEDSIFLGFANCITTRIVCCILNKYTSTQSY